MSGNTVPTPIVDRNGKLTTVHKKAGGGGKASANRIKAVGTPPSSKAQPNLSEKQQKLLDNARYLATLSDHGSLVSGHDYRTAIALEKKGYGTVRYQGHSLGWFTAKPADREETNFERLTREANNTDINSPGYNTDMDIILPGTTKTSRDMILAGIDPNDSDAAQGYIEEQMDIEIRKVR